MTGLTHRTARLAPAPTFESPYKIETVEDIVSYLAARFPSYVGIAGPCCETGEPYVTIGRAKEGDPLPAFESAAFALNGWLWHFEEYAKTIPGGKRRKLYWRRHPTLERSGKRWKVYGRLLLTTKRPAKAGGAVG